MGQGLEKYFVDYSDESKITRNNTKFAFSNFQQFKNNCKAESASWLFRKDLCSLSDLYQHSFNFIYNIPQPQNRSGPYPSVSWYSQKITSDNSTEIPKYTSSFHRHWIIDIELITDRNGFLHSTKKANVIFSFDSDIPVKFLDIIKKYL